MDKNFTPAGELDQRVEVLELRFEAMATLGQPTRNRYFWAVVRRPWAKVTPSSRKNVYSVHGIGASGVSVILRHQPLSLDNALLWRGKYCFITSIAPMGRAYWQVEAAVVEMSDCSAEAEAWADGTTPGDFPAILTEKYLSHDQLEPMAINDLGYVLVTPKSIRLKPGFLVTVDGVRYPIRVAHVLDPHKNEYELERRVDL